MKLCTIDGCGRQSRSRGWCSLHYRRWWRHGDPTHPVQERNIPVRLCDVAGCDNEHEAHGMCVTHLWRWMKRGTTDPPSKPDPAPEPVPDVEPAPTCVDCGGEPAGGMIRCWPCAAADLAARTSRKPFGQSSAKASEVRPAVRQVRAPRFTGRQGAA